MAGLILKEEVMECAVTVLRRTAAHPSDAAISCCVDSVNW